MKKFFLNFWAKRSLLIASASLLLVSLHLILRFALRADEKTCNLPLAILLLAGGIPLLLELIQRIWKREFGADFLAGIAIVASFFLHEYLAGSIVVFMLSGGKALEEFALRNASSVLKALAKQMPSTAHCRKDKEVSDISIQDIKIGDELLVYPHEICPVDGLVIEGSGHMNEAYLTGEPFEIDKTPGSDVISGAINGETALTIRAIKLAVDSRYAKIVEVLKASEKNKPHMQRLADRLGGYYTPAALAVACIAWAVSGDAIRFLAVLMIATPCPLLIGIPVAVIGSIALAAKRGIIIKNPAVLEQIEECSVAIFDKTGTLTYGQPQVSEILCAPGYIENELLGFAAALERYSKHPLAHSIVDAAQQQSVPLLTASEIHEAPGEGLKGIVSGRKIQITGRNNAALANAKEMPATGAGLECVCLIDEKYAGLFRFRDTPRPEGFAFIQHLRPKHKLNRAIIISGDRETEVRYLAQKVGITEIHAEKSPEEKLALVKAETSKAKTIYAGDGINDAPALMAATVGIAIGRNSDITSESAGAVIMDSSLEKVDELMHISRRMRTIALQSAIGGIVLSFIGVYLAATGHLSPIWGGILQEGIDLLAILNALRAALPPKTLTDY